MRERESHNRLMSHGDVYIYIYIYTRLGVNGVLTEGIQAGHSSWALELEALTDTAAEDREAGRIG